MPNRETEEKRQHSTPLIPYSFYEVRIPEELNNVPMHWHGEFELNRILHGSGEFFCGDRRFPASKGDIILVPPNMLHAAYPINNGELVYQAFVFHSSMLGASGSDRATLECIRPIVNGTLTPAGPICPDTANYDIFKSASDQIFACVFGNLPQLDLLLKSELLRFFWCLNQSVHTVSEETVSISYSEIIRPALEYMQKNYQEPITIEQLADLVHLSKSYFMGCFKRAVGIGAIEHLTHLRINAACDALNDANRKISEIAFSCGYGNLSNFNRQFLQIVGCSPKEYRKKKQS